MKMKICPRFSLPIFALILILVRIQVQNRTMNRFKYKQTPLKYCQEIECHFLNTIQIPKQ